MLTRSMNLSAHLTRLPPLIRRAVEINANTSITRGFASGSATSSLSPPPPPPPSPSPITQMLYDGSCPLCAKEVSFLRTFNRAQAVSFINIADPAFDPSPYSPITREALIDEMHVYDLTTNTMHKRVPAFHHLYSTLGYPFLGFTRVWPFNVLSDQAYGFIARNKHHLARFMG